MNIKPLTPKQSLNKAYRKATVFREEFENFRNNITTLLDNIDHEEREENHKIHLKTFLDETYYRGLHLINSKDTTDLVIYLENKQSSNAGVLLEVKRPTNKAEMISLEEVNNKALHELVLYYLQERIERKNDEIKYLIATNIYEWFIFDAVYFEKLFFKNKKLLTDYNKWKTDQKVSGSTDHFYNEIVKPYIESIKDEIPCTYFNIDKYKKYFPKTDPESEEKLIPLLKILSPVHLLKQPFANDSNSLDRKFYHELLHIIGLEEVKQKNKRLINRKEKGKRDPGSFIENTIQILKVDGALDRIEEPGKFGGSKEEQLYHIALELSLTWINRILFLKLLESQLYNYHKNDDYKFLNIKTVPDFDELYKLFHSVLAINYDNRAGSIKTKYGKVPYLNSSLFEITDLENQAIRVNQLDDGLSIKVYQGTKLVERKGTEINVLEYLFEFLDSYNFTSEGKEKIEEEKKTLINASVLGLIFEKINGYKDGSYFTPGFITMYMSRETIRRALIQKFNEHYDWKCETFDDLKNHLSSKRNTKEILEANEVVNSLKICDPAVGSGHFLVSSLNEIITIKSELGILADENGVILNGYEVKIENDELIVTYNYGEDIFEYHPVAKEKIGINQKVQETLFREKQTIIENCLFGVDINPNSVKIAQLRLWIELLKNAYYTKESGYTELETLPNIDINIKVGNSLVSKFDIKKDIFSAADRKTLDVYKLNVAQYKNEHNREKRKELKKAIEKTKERIRGFAVDPLKKENDTIEKLSEQFHKLNTDDLFGSSMDKEEKAKIEEKKNKISEKLTKAIEQRNKKAEEYKALYADAFEWRFEFPEVLDDEGDFVGFDVVIGNPPWGDIFQKNEKVSLKELYPKIDSSTPNAFTYFIGLTLKLKSNLNALLLPDSFLIKDFEKTRTLLKDYITNLSWYQNTGMPFDKQPFKDVEHDVCMIIYEQNIVKHLECYRYYFDDSVKEEVGVKEKEKMIFNKYGNKYNLLINDIDYQILKKIDDLDNLYDIVECHEGIHTGNIRNKLFLKNKARGDEKPLYIGAKYGDIIMNYYAKRIGYYVDYRKEIINKKKGEYASLREERIFVYPKIYITRTGNPFKAFIDNDTYASNNFFSLQFKDLSQNTFQNLSVILCLLNSKFSQYLIRKIIAPRLGSTFIETKIIHLLSLPIPAIDESVKLSLSKMVNQIIEKKDNDIDCDTSLLESKIDQIVYKLYGLTYEEVKVIDPAFALSEKDYNEFKIE